MTRRRGQGCVIFAAALLLTIGTLNVIDGIAAISNAHFYVANAQYVFGRPEVWGMDCSDPWRAPVADRPGHARRNQFARWTGVVILSLNALAQLLMIPAYPFWSLTIFAIDVIALYGLVAYGARIARP